MLHRSFVAYEQSPVVVHPPKAALDIPALTITGAHLDWTLTFRLAALAALNGRDGRLNPPAAQVLTQFIALKRAVIACVKRKTNWRGEVYSSSLEHWIL
jgi:hypothetical protein